jgi:protein O-GlcNAc transferase
MREFEQAAARDPLNADSYFNMGSVHHREGRLADADWSYSHCLALAPNHAKCNHARAVLMLEQGKRDEAFATVQRWRQLDPASPDPIVELAWLEKQTGRTEEARTLLQNALALQPRHPRALAELASLYEASNQNDRALALYQRALSYDPTQPDLTAKVADLRGATDGRTNPYSPPPLGIDTRSSPRTSRDLRYDFR